MMILADETFPDDIFLTARALVDLICPFAEADERASFVAAKWPAVARTLLAERNRNDAIVKVFIRRAEA